MTTSNPTNGAILPSEVGWQFVPQYYTFVNKDPNRLHCFYTKTSTFSHGTEGEDVKPCHGQQEIHSKITSIGFQDCKVFIHSVDAQASANGGIIIQVIGEMSNHGDPWRKFVQTFFLAEQPNGYFVLNDIFRFLKEDAVEEGDEVAEADAVEPAVTLAPAPEPSPAPVAVSPAPPPAELAPEPPRSPSPPPPQPAAAQPPPPVEEETPAEVAEPEPEVAEPTPAPQTNGDSAHAPEPEKPAVADQSTAPPPAAAPAPVHPPAAAPQAAAPPAPAPAPSAPRTWASLAATNARKWGSAVSTESRGVTETPSPVVSATPSRTQTPPVQRHASQGVQSAATNAQAVNHPSCFVKGVTEPVTSALLTNTLTQRFGPIKDLEIVRSRACAFLEFQTVDAARRAIVASLPQSQGGEGGIWVDVGGEVGNVRISVETKKERGDRPPTRGRGGVPPGGQANGDGRGGFRGRGQAPRGRGGQAVGK